MNQKIDTHVHLLLSKKQIDPDWQAITDICEIAMQSDIDGLCVTEHIESVGYFKLIKGLFIDNVLNGDLSENGLILKNRLTLYPAAEIQLLNGSNIGVHTKIDSLLELNRTAGFYTLGALCEKLDDLDNDYALVAHHILWPGKEYPDLVELTNKVHAVEIPAKDLEKISEYVALTSSYKKATTGGSDSHTPIQIGACYTVFEKSQRNLSHFDLITSIKNSQCNNAVHPFAQRLVNMSKIYRKNISLNA